MPYQINLLFPIQKGVKQEITSEGELQIKFDKMIIISNDHEL